MAWLQTDPTSGNQHICFRFGGKRFRRSLETTNLKKARRKLARLEDTIELVQAGRIEFPSNVDVPTFLLSDGKLNIQHKIQDETLSPLFDAFFESIPNGSLEPRTIAQMRSHRRHIEKHFGLRFSLTKLCFSDLQSYVASRSKGKGFRGQLFHGRGLGSYNAGIVQSLNLLSGESIRTAGGYGQIWCRVHPHITISVLGGVDNPRDVDLSPGQRSKNEMLGANVFLDLTSSWQVGWIFGK